MSDHETDLTDLSAMRPWERVVFAVLVAAFIACGILLAFYPSHACACVFAEGYSKHVHINPTF